MERLIIKNPPGETPSPFWESFILPVLKHKRVVYYTVSITVLATLVVCLLMKNKYTSTASILPSAPATLSSELKDMAAGTLGELGLGAAPSLENVSALYPSVLTSRLISERMLQRRITFSHGSKTKSMTLAEYIDAPNFDRALRRLKKIVRVESDKKTGVITLLVTTEYPEFSAAVARAYLEELDNYNINYRQSTATENEKFTSRRLREIRAELERAEDTLRSFRASNMNYMVSNDPSLQLESARLSREVDIKATLYLTMAQQNELARIEAAKDVPVVQVLDRGSVPQEKSSPRRSLYMAAALFGSLVLSVFLALWIELSVKREVNRNLRLVISSPEVRMSPLEARIVRRLVRFGRTIPAGNAENDTIKQ